KRRHRGGDGHAGGEGIKESGDDDGIDAAGRGIADGGVRDRNSRAPRAAGGSLSQLRDSARRKASSGLSQPDASARDARDLLPFPRSRVGLGWAASIATTKDSRRPAYKPEAVLWGWRIPRSQFSLDAFVASCESAEPEYSIRMEVFDDAPLLGCRAGRRPIAVV